MINQSKPVHLGWWRPNLNASLLDNPSEPIYTHWSLYLHWVPQNREFRIFYPYVYCYAASIFFNAVQLSFYF
jgi:hypothetical protein